MREEVGNEYIFSLPPLISFTRVKNLDNFNFRSVKVSNHFTCVSTNVIYCITFTLCKKIYMGAKGRRLADRFREHLRDAEQNNTDAAKPVRRHFNLLNHSHHNMTICRLSLHHGNTDSRKNLEQKFIFQLGTLSPHGINERSSFH